MSLKKIAAREDGRAYLASRCGEGLSLCQMMAPKVRKLKSNTISALVPEGADLSCVDNLNVGGIGGDSRSRLAEFLVREFGGMSLVLELPLWRPEDQGTRTYEGVLLFNSDEVYGAASLELDSEESKRLLTVADAAYAYNLLVVDQKFEDILINPAWIPQVVGSAIAIVSGAFDGEGFIFGNLSPLRNLRRRHRECLAYREKCFQDDGKIGRILDNGNMTCSVAIREKSNPGSAATAFIEARGQLDALLQSDRWQ